MVLNSTPLHSAPLGPAWPLPPGRSRLAAPAWSPGVRQLVCRGESGREKREKRDRQSSQVTSRSGGLSKSDREVRSKLDRPTQFTIFDPQTIYLYTNLTCHKNVATLPLQASGAWHALHDAGGHHGPSVARLVGRCPAYPYPYPLPLPAAPTRYPYPLPLPAPL
jgi:hypothetical protein